MSYNHFTSRISSPSRNGSPPTDDVKPSSFDFNLNKSGFSLTYSLLRSSNSSPIIGLNQRGESSTATGYGRFEDLSRISFSEERRDLSVSRYLMQFQNIKDNLAPQFQPATVFDHGDWEFERKPNLDQLLSQISNPNGRSSNPQRVCMQPTDPSFVNTNVTQFNKSSNGRAVQQPDVSCGIRVPNFSGNRQSALMATSARLNNPTGYCGAARRDQALKLTPASSLNVYYPYGMKEKISSPSHNHQVDGEPKTPNSDDSLNKPPARDVISPTSPNSGSETGFVMASNTTSAENGEIIKRMKNDGRAHSLPHKKNGPYYCPFDKCDGLVFATSQTFGSHIRAFHYGGETKDKRKKREATKYATASAKKKLSLSFADDGRFFTVLPQSLNFKSMRPEGRIEKNGRAKAKVNPQQQFDQAATTSTAGQQGFLNGANVKGEPM